MPHDPLPAPAGASPRPRSRAPRIALGLLLLILTLPLAAWLLGILVSVTFDGFAIARNSASSGATCWVGSGSTLIRASTVRIPVRSQGWEFVWSTGYSTPAVGQTFFHQSAPGFTELEITHALALPVLLLSIGGLTYVALLSLRRTPRHDQCPSCGYSTVGIASNVCPECGRALPRSGATPS